MTKVTLSKKIINDLEKINHWLMSTGLSHDRNFKELARGNKIFIEHKPGNQITNLYVQKTGQYSTNYWKHIADSNYSFKLKDGSLIQCYYIIESNKIIKQTFTFYDSPYLENMDENNVNEYEAEIKECPQYMRFDYDPGNKVDVIHPAGHFTIGSNKNCRIPVSAPLTIISFIKFIIKNFYHEHWQSLHDYLKKNKGGIKEDNYISDITSEEKMHIHIHLPTLYETQSEE